MSDIIVIPKDAPLRQAISADSLCKKCKYLANMDCKKKYKIEFDRIDGILRVIKCTGYVEQE